jgi:hypothetical protein
MLHLKVNYRQKTIFIALAGVGIGFCSLILNILDLFDSWDKMYCVCCVRQLQGTLFVGKVLV